MGKNKNASGGGGGKAGGGGGKGKKDDDSGSGNVKSNPQKLHIRHIFCEKKSSIDPAWAKIQERIAAGDKVEFDKLAREYSEDKAKDGGSLGKVQKDSPIDPKFRDVAWGLIPSTPDNPNFDKRLDPNEEGKEAFRQPFKSSLGWHILIVEKS